MSLLAILVLAAGTFAFRIAGPLLAGRYDFSPAAQAWMTSAATVLLAGLIATSTLIQDAPSRVGRAPPGWVWLCCWCF